MRTDAAHEKMELERAYADADVECERRIGMGPSAPPYRHRYSGEVDAEAGPSTLPVHVGVASAPPWDGDEFDGEFEGEAEEEGEGEASAPPFEYYGEGVEDADVDVQRDVGVDVPDPPSTAPDPGGQRHDR